MTDYSLRVGLILDLRREVISDEAGVVSDLVLDDERNVGGHRQRHLGGEWRGFAEEIEVAKGKSQRHLGKRGRTRCDFDNQGLARVTHEHKF